MIKTTILYRLFPIELRKSKLVEFMNLRQVRISVKQYSFKITKLSKYALTMVAKSSARMYKFVMGVSSMVEKDIVWLCSICIVISLGS